MADYPEAAQINLMRHQYTDISSGKQKKRKSFVKPKQPSHKNVVNEITKCQVTTRKVFTFKNVHKNKDRCSKSGDSTHVEGFQCPAKKFLCKACHEFGHFTSLCFQKKQAPFKSRRQVLATLKITVPVKIHSACKSNCSAHKPV